MSLYNRKKASYRQNGKSTRNLFTDDFSVVFNTYDDSLIQSPKSVSYHGKEEL